MIPSAPAPGASTSDSRAGHSAGRVKITNQVLNRKPYVRFRDARRLVRDGRAEWVGECQVRLLAHPANQVNAEQAAAGYTEAAAVPVKSAGELKHIPIIGKRKGCSAAAILLSR